MHTNPQKTMIIQPPKDDIFFPKSQLDFYKSEERHTYSENHDFKLNYNPLLQSEVNQYDYKKLRRVKYIAFKEDNAAFKTDTDIELEERRKMKYKKFLNSLKKNMKIIVRQKGGFKNTSLIKNAENEDLLKKGIYYKLIVDPSRRRKGRN